MKRTGLFFILLFTLISSRGDCQWASEGVLASHNCVTGSRKLVPTEDGGAWVGWNCGYDAFIQRIDADGYVMFDTASVSVTPDSLEVANILMDILAVEGDELMVAFYNGGLHPSGRLCVYGQCFSAGGDRLFDPYEARVSSHPQMDESGSFKIGGDGNGGFWRCTGGVFPRTFTSAV